MPVLTADNRDLSKGAKYSYLSANTSSGVTSLTVENSEDFLPDQYILIGEFGSAYAEIKKISQITAATNTLVISTTTRFPHAESTKITIIKYDQVRFFHTTDTTFSAGDPLRTYVLLGNETTQFDITNPAGTTFRYTYDTTGTNPDIEKFVKTGYTIVINAQNFDSNNNGTFTATGVGTNYFEVTNASGVAESNKTIGTGYIKVNTNYIDIDATSDLTKFDDTGNSSGYGWFVFYNSSSATASQNSNAIPYAGFAENSVKSIIDNFYGLLNNKEMELIKVEDAYKWLNEAYAIARNELNLINKEYTGSDEYDISVTDSVKEYSLPSNFSEILSVTDSSGSPIDVVDLKDVSYNDGVGDSELKYYIRGSYIGFSPTPSSGATYTIRYLTTRTAINSYYDSLDFPDDNYYCLIDFMLFRASIKLSRPDLKEHLSLFKESIKDMKLKSGNRDGSLDSFGLAESSNI